MNVKWLFNKCRRYEASLSMLAAGVLDASERAALETHLAGCPACRTKLAELQRLTRGLNEADRIIVLHNGQLVADGEPEAVIASPVVQQAYLGTSTVEEPA